MSDSTSSEFAGTPSGSQSPLEAISVSEADIKVSKDTRSDGLTGLLAWIQPTPATTTDIRSSDSSALIDLPPSPPSPTHQSRRRRRMPCSNNNICTSIVPSPFRTGPIVSIFSSESTIPIMLQAFRDGKYTDLVISCSFDDSEFNAHKIILCTQSKYFAKACDEFTTPGDNHIVIDGFEGRTIAKVFEFLYSGQYSLYDFTECDLLDETDDITREHDNYRKKVKSEVQTHIDVLRASQHLGIADLEQFTENLLIDFISTRIDDIFAHSDYFFLTILRMVIRDGQSDALVEAIASAVATHVDLLMDPDALSYYRRELIELLGSMSGKLAFTLLEKFLMPRVTPLPVTTTASAIGRLKRKQFRGGSVHDEGNSSFASHGGDELAVATTMATA